MKFHRFKGAGLPDVYLVGGVAVEGCGDEQTTTYSDLDGLYREIARVIGTRCDAMTGSELRFLRKRLAMSQADVGALGGKTEQAAAQWEKGIVPVPKAEANLMRLCALHNFGSRDDSTRAMSQLMNGAPTPKYRIVIKFEGKTWRNDNSLALDRANDRSVPLAHSRSIAENCPLPDEVQYTMPSSGDISPVPFEATHSTS